MFSTAKRAASLQAWCKRAIGIEVEERGRAAFRYPNDRGHRARMHATRGFPRGYTRLLAVLVLLFAWLHPGQAAAEYREPCRLRFTATGKVYERECIYTTGAELNQHMRSSIWDRTAVYAVVAWWPGETTFIRLPEAAKCGPVASDGCARGLLPTEGVDQAGKTWKVCLRLHLRC
jgi:hypothetical protein